MHLKLGSNPVTRWAAKEAVIKAHRHRRLYMHEVSIAKTSPFSGKLVALVDPICDTVELDTHVAGVRGLRGFSTESRELPKGPPVTGNYDTGVAPLGDPKTGPPAT